MTAKILKTLALTLTLTLSSLAMASDLENDLRTPFSPMTNPFTQTQKVELGSDTAAVVKNLLLQCAFVPTSVSSDGLSVIYSADLKPACASTISVSHYSDGDHSISNKMKIQTGELTLIVVSWDGSYSDGGDEQALGIYNASGRRVAVYPALYTEGNVIDGLAHAMGVTLPTVHK